MLTGKCYRFSCVTPRACAVWSPQHNVLSQDLCVSRHAYAIAGPRDLHSFSEGKHEHELKHNWQSNVFGVVLKLHLTVSVSNTAYDDILACVLLVHRFAMMFNFLRLDRILILIVACRMRFEMQSGALRAYVAD